MALLIVGLTSASFGADERDPRELFWDTEADEKTASAAAENCSFYVLLVFTGGVAFHDEVYELSYAGSMEDLSLFGKSSATGKLSYRTLKEAKEYVGNHDDLVQAVQACIDLELFSLPKSPPYIEDVSPFGGEGCIFWVFVKYGEHRNCFRRSDHSHIVNQLSGGLRKLKKSERPATAPAEAHADGGDVAR